MSASYEYIKMAADILDAQNSVSVIDSANLSTGIGLLVIEAAVMASEGLSREEITEMLQAPPAQEEEPEAAEQPQEAQESAEEPKADAVNDYAEEVKRLSDEVRTLRAQLQKKNIQQNEITPARKETAAEILALVINPDYGKLDNNGGIIK